MIQEQVVCMVLCVYTCGDLMETCEMKLHLLVFLAQSGCFLLVGRAVFRALFGPHLCQLLGDVSDGHAGVLALHRGPVL